MVQGQTAALVFSSDECILPLFGAPINSSDTPALQATGLDTAICSHCADDGVEFLRALVHFDPSVRMTPDAAISHR